MAIGTLWSVTLDCADPRELGRFWSTALGGEIAYDSDDFVGVKLPGGMWIGNYRVGDYAPPAWSDSASDKQFHLDVSVDDLDAAQAAALELGATVAEHQPDPGRWRVLLDPAGHPFCITDQSVG